MDDCDIFLLSIALNEAGFETGLGISVKGKTAVLEVGGSRDLGLFVKSISDSGAAAKVGI